MAAVKYNMEWVAGDTEKHSLRWLDSAGISVDLIGATGRMQLKVNRNDPSPAINKEATIAADVITFAFTVAETQGLLSRPNGNAYLFDTEVTLLDGTTKTLTSGRVVVTPSITE